MQSVRRALVSRRVLEQVELVIIFGIPPLSCRYDLGGDLLALGREVLRLHLLGNALRDCLLLGGMVEDS